MRAASQKTSSEPTASKETPETMTAKRGLTRNARRAARSLGLAALLLGLCATPALAAPEFDVQLQSDPLANEIQRVTVKATAGQYRLNLGEGGPGVSQTADINFNATAGQLAAALNAIDNVSAGGGSVSVTGGPGNALGTNPYLVTFGGGPLRMTDVAEMSVSAGSTPLSGGSSLAAIRTTQGGGVSRSDRRIDYTVTVRNTASTEAAVGDTLTCDARSASWFQLPTPLLESTFTFAWRSNGAPATGPTTEPTSTTGTYVVQSADEGHLLQCLVKGTNDGGAALSFSTPLAVSPVPDSPNPPAFGASNRPTIENKGTVQAGERVCKPPTGWSGVAAPDWQFQWLRNGEPIAGATSDTYVPVSGAVPGENDRLVNLQCQVTGSNASGGAIATSSNSLTGTNAEFNAAPPTGHGKLPPNNNSENRPFVDIGNSTSGPVTLEVELPAGEQTFVFDTVGTGWACTNHPPVDIEPAKAVCTRSDTLNPNSSYPSLTVAIALGGDAPNHSAVKATVSGGGALTASAVDTFLVGPHRPFEITFFETRVPDLAGNEETQAGAHPISAEAGFRFSEGRTFSRVNSNPNVIQHLSPVENVKSINTHTPRGFVGNALAVPELCASAEETLTGGCPESSVVGGIDISVTGTFLANLPIYAIEPEFGVPAQFAFRLSETNSVYTFYPELRADDGYAISLLSAPVGTQPAIRGVDATLCGFGGKTDQPGGAGQFTGCKQPGELGSGPNTDANPTPLVTLPTRCDGRPPVTELEIDSWQNPGDFKTREFEAQPVTGCEKVRFEPRADVQPISSQADSPTGLEVELEMPTEGVEGKDDEGNLDHEALSQANMKLSRVVFPQGMAINASAGHGLTGCSLAQIKLKTNQPHSCPHSSKVGEIEIDTPLIRETLTGGVYLGKQSEAPAGALIGLHLIFESKKDGIIIKVPGEVKANPVTGQLITTFDEIAEAPFSRAKVSLAQGPRASLLTPPRCGTYEIKAELVPWTIADLDNPKPEEIVTDTTSFQVTQGPNGGPCPSGALAPGFNAGVTNPTAGQTSPFVMRLTREDGSDRFTGLELAPPLGLTAYLKGIPYCSDAALASISGALETGQPQINTPSCPPASLIGRASAGAGAGPNPLFVDTGRVYLAGPYKGAPVSLAVVTPAVAGPLDLGNVLIRTALHIDPVSAQIRAISDPIPHILHGVLLNVRDIRVAIDRPNFTLNPTSCEEKLVGARVGGLSGQSVDLASRFQVNNCAALGFKPNVTLRLVGGTKRGGHPSLRAVVRPRAGDANIRRAAVTLPRSAFLDQANIRTICTRVQWAQDNCPKAARYGFARAWTPLLDQPLQGPVYLRSSNNQLPDLVADLRGPAHQPIKIEAAFRTDSIRGGIRSTLDFGPDAPVSHFLLRMQGGKRKGLIVNSRDICRGTNRAHSRMIGHNGRRENSRPKVHAANCGKARKAAKRKGGKGKANRQSLSNLRQVR